MQSDWVSSQVVVGEMEEVSMLLERVSYLETLYLPVNAVLVRTGNRGEKAVRTEI